MTFTEKFTVIADKVEYAAGSPYGVLAFVGWCAAMPLINIDVANYGISVATAGILFLTIGSARRHAKAVQAKLDDLEESIDVANSANKRLEELPEDEIERRRS